MERFAIRALALLGVLLVWELVRLGELNELVPSFGSVVAHIGDIVRRDTFLSDVGHTLYRLGGGFLLAVGVGTVIGMLMGGRRAAASYFRPLVLVGLTIPGISWALITIFVFGLGDAAAITAIAIITTPGIVLNVYEGAKAVDGRLTRMAQVFRAPHAMTLRHVVFPQVLPALIAAIRYGFGLAWQMTAIVEIFGLGNGMGYRIVQAYATGRLRGGTAMQEILGWTLLFMVLMLATEYLVFQTMERRSTRWLPQRVGAL